MKNEISLGEAFAYCFKQPGYLVILLIATIIAVVLFRSAIRRYRNEQNADGYVIGGIAVALVVFFCALLIKPCGVKANTSKEKAERGVYDAG